MGKIVIVFHSSAGHTRQLVNAVAEGVQQSGGNELILVAVEQVDDYWNQLEQADTLIFGCPTYMGNVSADFKVFMDKTSSIWFERKWQDKLAGGFTNSGSLSGDKLSTLIAMSVFSAQHGMVWVGPAEICSSFDAKPEDVNRLGSQLGVMAQCDPYADPKQSPPTGDRETARLFGQRMAQKTKVWRAGHALEARELTT